MGQLRGIGVVIGLTFLLGACEGSPNPSDQATAPLGEPEAALPPPPPPQGAFLAQLTPEQTSQLNALGVQVVAPGQVPPTFSVVDIRGRSVAGNELDEGAAYAIVYRDGANRCFAIEFAASRIGDVPVTENRLPIDPPLFADQSYGLNYGLYEDGELRSQFPDPQLYTDWLVATSGAYRLIGASYINSTFPDQPPCQDISPEEAVQIVESLTVLAPEETGDGEAPQ
ncbi:hypothetical protein [Pseudanabaena sp. FACHB-2040]|uniref:hypothetical protein n=1 Tax=Pseudanabaena sp. FACHB-2040 TaxID=2692859 RepID=UPI00168948D3|nr:hypothetical protein [Pseudanabaena sp. FACHB-2040]MBD2260754.1 hypothetical protein [Pseudanabaena sp. FACHB-2040]